MAFTLGFQGKLYRNTGSWGTPVWDEITNVRDLNLELSATDVDSSTRAAAGIALSVPGLINVTLTWGMVWDAADTDLQAIDTAFWARSTVELAAMEGDITVSGKEGFRSDDAIFARSWPQPIDGLMGMDITARPTNSVNVPTWYVVP